MYMLSVLSGAISLMLGDKIETDLRDLSDHTEPETLDLNSLIFILNLVPFNFMIFLRSLSVVEANFRWKGSHMLNKNMETKGTHRRKIIGITK